MNTTAADQITHPLRAGTMSEQAGNYERSTQMFGRTFGWRVEPLPMSGLDGWAVRSTVGESRGGVLEAWFLSREHACRWVDLMIERT